MNLVEIMITMALFSLVVFVFATCFVHGLRNYRITSTSAEAFRSGSIGMSWVMNEIRQLKKIYLPNETQSPNEWTLLTRNTGIKGEGFLPGHNANPPFIIKKYNSETKKYEVIAYKCNYINHSVQRMLYNDDFDPANKSTWNGFDALYADERANRTRTIAQNSQDLEFQLNKNPQSQTKKRLLMIYFTTYPDEKYIPIETKVNINE